MQLIRIHRRTSALVAIALAATAIPASAASARVLEGPLHQTEQAGAAVPPILAPARPSELRATETQKARAFSYRVPPTARYSNAQFNGHPKAPPTALVVAPKLGAPSDSFHWGDAAIGAGIAVTIVLLVSAGTLVVRRRTQLSEA